MKQKNKLHYIVWVVLSLQILMLLYVAVTFHIEDMTVAKGEEYSFDKDWTITVEGDNTKHIVNLPFAIPCPAGYTVTAENTIPNEFRGMSIYFLSADKEIEVYIDNQLMYEFGKNDVRTFGKTPGSIMNQVDIPLYMKEGKIKIKMISPYDNYAGAMESISVAKSDVAILTLLRRNFLSISLCIVILFGGILMIVLALIQHLSGQHANGMEYLGFLCILGFIYYIIETKILSLFYGNQTLYSILIFFVLMLMPILLLVYYIKNIDEKYVPRLTLLLLLAGLNAVTQIFLQVLNVCDFLQMAFATHIFILLTATILIVINIHSWIRKKDSQCTIELLAVVAMVAGAITDIVRTYMEGVGDFGKYGRFGMATFSVLMVYVQFRKVTRQYSYNVEENSRLMQREVETVVKQNLRLQSSKNDAEMARAQAEHAQKLAEEARASALLASQAKSNFLANMSHEIRTPINAVLGMDTMILRECKDEEILEYATNIQSAGQTLLSLINDILDFSKIETGKLEIVETEYHTDSLLNDIYHMIAPKAQEKNLKFMVQNQSDLPYGLWGDEVRIREVLINLLTNAVKYTFKGEVVLSVIFEKTDEDNILVCANVKDTGMGIREEDIDKLFNTFQRIDEKKNRNIEGTGLGLAITQQLTQLMGGTISVTSEYGKGSVFSVRIPQKVMNWQPIGAYQEKRSAVVKNVEDEKFFVAPQAKILVVDDVNMNLQVIKGLLKRSQAKLDMVMSGQECLGRVSEYKYDLILLDHMMPGIDGVETLQKMKVMEDNLNKDTPVIALTANAIAGAREEYLQDGFTDYLSKPIKIEALEDMLRKYLSQLQTERKGENTDKNECKVTNQILEKDAENIADIKSNPTSDSASEITTDSSTDISTNISPNISTDQKDQTAELPLSEKLSFLDVKTGMEYCLNSEEVYLEILNEFINGQCLRQVVNAYEQEDYPKYSRLAHSIKSSALTIGATKLSEIAKKSELLAKEGDIQAVKKNHDNLVEAYGQMLSQIRKVLRSLKD